MLLGTACKPLVDVRPYGSLSRRKYGPIMVISLTPFSFTLVLGPVGNAHISSDTSCGTRRRRKRTSSFFSRYITRTISMRMEHSRRVPKSLCMSRPRPPCLGMTALLTMRRHSRRRVKSSGPSVERKKTPRRVWMMLTEGTTTTYKNTGWDPRWRSLGIWGRLFTPWSLVSHDAAIRAG